MARPGLSVTIITLNEEQNLGRALESVKWADEVLVVDSGSTDKTLDIARDFGAKVLKNPWTGYGQQKNFAQDHATHPWILNLDADECVPPLLATEIQKRLEQIGTGECQARGFYLPRKTYYLGRWIQHGGWYPNYLVRLADRNHARWTEPRVHEELRPDGPVEKLETPLEHYTFSGIRDQILTNLRFSQLGSQELKNKAGGRFLLARMLLKPLGKFLETYVLKKGFLDGVPGLIIAVNAAHSMFLKHAFLIEERIHGKSNKIQAD